MINISETIEPLIIKQGINASETVEPLMANMGINASETVPPNGETKHIDSIILGSGESISDSYIINSMLAKQGKQANIYLAKKWGKNYVVKHYHAGWKPSGKIKDFLSNVRHPNIAHVVENGMHGERYYEIYEHYSKGTLEEADALPINYIQNVIVPSINEGLHELHKNGIVHCDIKPSNLFFSDDKERIIIGDCGISGYINDEGSTIETVRGTPEYAPRVKALLWSAAMSPSYDYGSFGLVLCKAVLGKSIFTGMSVEEISAAWERGIELPSNINGRIALLIKGLINENEEQRWGYLQVKRWCEGEYMSTNNRSIYSRTRSEQKKVPLIFGRIDGATVTVTSLHQLANAIKSQWIQATKIVKRREVIEFVRQYNEKVVDEIRKLQQMQDVDAAVFRLLTFIDDENEKISYCNKEYSSLSDFVEKLSTGKDEIAKKFVSSGLLVFWLRYKGYDEVHVEKLEALIKRNGCNDMASISTICFALQGKKNIQLFDTEVNSLNELVSIVSKKTISEIHNLLEQDNFIAWMNRMGYEKEMRKMREV